MLRADLVEEWKALAPAWIHDAREGPNPVRAALLDAPMLALCGDVTGQRVLDSGCGEGRFCRLLAARGAATVLGLDLCEPMIAAARELQGDCDRYEVADVQRLDFLSDGSFDLAVSYLNLCDLPDSAANVREIFRVLAPGGRFVVANLHPMRSATGGWHRAEDGTKLHAVLDRYFEEGERHWRMLGQPFTNFHRSLQTMLREFREAGFVLRDLVEPTISAENVARFPGMADELRVPNFILFALEKPAR